jgi:hypothetical protein
VENYSKLGQMTEEKSSDLCKVRSSFEAVLLHIVHDWMKWSTACVNSQLFRPPMPDSIIKLDSGTLGLIYFRSTIKTILFSIRFYDRLKKSSIPFKNAEQLAQQTPDTATCTSMKDNSAANRYPLDFSVAWMGFSKESALLSHILRVVQKKSSLCCSTSQVASGQ